MRIDELRVTKDELELAEDVLRITMDAQRFRETNHLAEGINILRIYQVI